MGGTPHILPESPTLEANMVCLPKEDIKLVKKYIISPHTPSWKSEEGNVFFFEIQHKSNLRFLIKGIVMHVQTLVSPSY